MTLREIDRQIRNLQAERRLIVQASMPAFRDKNNADAMYRRAHRSDAFTGSTRGPSHARIAR